MADHIFTYGSLMVPAVMEFVTERTFIHEPATLAGFERFLVRGEVYPGIVASGAGKVAGRAYRDVGPAVLERLDFFEGDLYERFLVEVTTQTGHVIETFAYVVTDANRHMLSDQPWVEAEFIEKHLPGFLIRAEGWIAEIDKVGD